MQEPKSSGRRWVVAVCAVVALGVGASTAAALLWSSSVRAREHQAFNTAAANVRGSLETQLRRDTDFVRSVHAVLTMQPNVTPTGLQEWIAQLEDHQGRLGSYGALAIRAVPAAELASFQARRDADPAFRELVSGHVEPVTPSGRSRYCLISGGSKNVLRTQELDTVLQGDWCDPNSLIGGYRQNGVSRSQFTQTVTDSGQTLAYSATISGYTVLDLEAAVYRRGVPLATVAQRRAAVVGWVLGSFEIPPLLSSVLHGTRGLSVTLYHRDPDNAPAQFIGSVGQAADDPFTRSSSLTLDGTWIVTVSGAAVASGPSAGMQGLVVFLTGIAASMLLFTLVLVLARSRRRALAMVEEKTVQLRHQALHDALTGLPNRVLALDRAEQMLARARRQQLPVAALYVDVDGFKDVNDSFGHAAGDHLLRIVAERLESVIREGDTAARLGGDEFVVLVEGSTLDAGPELVAERLLEALRAPYDMTAEIGRELALTASVGVAFGLRGSADELLRDADVALYEAKTAGKNCHVLFRSGMQTAVQDRLTLQMDLIDALEQDQFLLLYQPTFDLRSEAVIGVEALIRWRHPTRGLISPADFIPIAETNGLIVPIGRWVLREACRQAASWHERGHRIGISVNVSARQLDSHELVDDVREALTHSGLEPAELTLEITESALMRDPDATSGHLRMLKELGVRIAIDDFGTGYSSLAYLRQLPADMLKIDRSFISNIAASKQSAALIHTLVQLGKTLQIETLAEGIEDQQQLETLQREQCDCGQGFLFARPLDVEAIEAFLEGAEIMPHPQPAA